MSLTITTNNIPRLALYGHELTEKEKKEFDYYDDIDDGYYVRYKGVVYDLNQFVRIDHGPISEQGWQGAEPSSAFSGVLVKFPEYNDGYVIMGHYWE